MDGILAAVEESMWPGTNRRRKVTQDSGKKKMSNDLIP